MLGRGLRGRVQSQLLEERTSVHTSSSKVYKRKPPGQGTSSKSSGSLNRDSNAEYPENIPSQIVRSRS